MKLDRFIRLSLGALIALVLVIAVAALLFVTESALNVWDRLRAGPGWLLVAYVVVLGALFAVAGWLVVRLLIRRAPARRRKRTDRPLSRADIEDRLRGADAAGINTELARGELRELARRQASGAVHLCFFGEVSSGKSSLLKALVPSAAVTVSPVGGSTLDIRHYRWQDGDGGEVLLTDVPGTGGVEDGLDRVAEDEARRAHAVLFVCDGDLTRAEVRALTPLLRLDKPLVLVLNKSDRYDAAEQALLIERLLEHLQALGGEWARDQVVAVSAGGDQEVLTRDAEGREALVRRTRDADIGVLVVAINRLLGQDRSVLDARRDRAVFRLAAEHLEVAESRYREQRSAQIIRNSTRKAVIGALAAVSPGTDVLIQGYIGTTMTRALCELYGAAPRDLDVEQFLDLSQSRVGRTLPLTLAVAGNGLKAFPGLGTVAGGLVHAVAYGLIFDALGRSLVQTLKRHGELRPEQAAGEFGENLGEHLEAGVAEVAQLALTERRRQQDDA